MCYEIVAWCLLSVLGACKVLARCLLGVLGVCCLSTSKSVAGQQWFFLEAVAAQPLATGTQVIVIVHTLKPLMISLAHVCYIGVLTRCCVPTGIIVPQY